MTHIKLLIYWFTHGKQALIFLKWNTLKACSSCELESPAGFCPEARNDPLFTLQTPTMHPCWRDIDLWHNKDTLPVEEEKGVLCCLCACAHIYVCVYVWEPAGRMMGKKINT